MHGRNKAFAVAKTNEYWEIFVGGYIGLTEKEGTDEPYPWRTSCIHEIRYGILDNLFHSVHDRYD